MIERDWHSCYSEGWTGIITPDAFAHPAKFSRGLIRRIYDHLFEQGYLHEGDTVVDPFGGVALGALHAMQHGCHWIGVELEQKFVDLGNQNIKLWLTTYAPHFPKWGSAVLVQGDSRELCEACGFETIEMIRAWLVEDRGAQYTLTGGLDERTIERKSFFRRLAESKGSPRIDYEVVIIQRRI